MATLVTFEQKNLISPIKLSFRTIQRAPLEKGTLFVWVGMPMVLWRDYLIGSHFKATGGLFLWSMTENSIFYFEVRHSFFPSSGALNLNSRQMESVPRCTKLIDDVLFVILDIFDRTHRSISFRCIHIPSLVISTQLPGGSLSLSKDAFALLLPKCIMKPPTIFPFCTKIYSIPACHPTYPRYCFSIRHYLQPSGVQWEVLEVEIDLSIPGPIKIFSRVSRQYAAQRPICTLHDSDDEIFLCLTLGRNGQPSESPSIRSLRVGQPDKWRVTRLEGVDKMSLFALRVDRDAGFVIIWEAENCPQSTRECGYICWLDERKAGDMVYSRTK